ncbi:MAG TPA: hypothetical protein ENH82_15485 [bacterium]|nr:hypothetical protein [bacterium]
MTTKKAKQVMNLFIKQCKKDNDSFMVVHFSREEDKFYGTHEMDVGDALIIINELIKQFKLSSEIVCKANKL